MTLEEQLRAFVEKTTREVLAPTVAAAKQMAPIGVCARVLDGQVEIVSKRKLVGPSFRDADGALNADAVLAFVNESLRRPEVELVLVAHEAWMTLLAEPPNDGVDRFGHLERGPDGRSEVVVCALHSEDFQTAVIHGIRRRGKARSLVAGPNAFEGVSLGGRLSREMPAKH